MMFIGFGFLMTFLKLYGYSAVGINMLIAAFVLQVALIVRGFIYADLIGGDSVVVVIVEAVVNVVQGFLTHDEDEDEGYDHDAAMETADIGESMFVHVFGAYFGLAVARVLYSDDTDEHPKEGAVYHSDLFSMIGTIFLWLYWPSFNGGAASGDEQHRAVINTYLSLAACTIVTFALSAIVDKKGRFDMVHIQNATLAGGVAVGTTADMPLEPWGAILMGTVAAVISVLGFKFLSPAMTRVLKIHDTCGVHNLHGMPGVLAGIAGAVMAALASKDKWGSSMCDIFPARAEDDSTACDRDLDTMRTAIEQGGYQMASLIITLLIAIVGGGLTGLLLKLPIWNMPQGDLLFDDEANWEVADNAVVVVTRNGTDQERKGAATSLELIDM
nr:hypothetical protein BaRGS_011699 [Batillaria attramentaria]